MDNDSLIDQARQLYAVLLIRRYTAPIESHAEIQRLNNLIMFAYCRYVRRLNRCAVCYQYRSYDCNRERGKNHTPCQRRHSTHLASSLAQETISALPISYLS